MRSSGTFDVSVEPGRVFTYLTNPRHLVAANHKGPIIEQSDQPLGAGSWFVLAFDQLRVRVAYTAFEPPHRVAATVTWTGRGSVGTSSFHEFVLIELDGGTRTRVEASFEGQGGLIRWGPLGRATNALTGWRMRRQIESS